MTRKHLPEKPGLEPGIDGELIGRDPRKMSNAELTALGHKPCSPLAALRARCVDCCADFHSEVRKCVAVDCPAWPFRMGKNPWRAPPSEAQQKARRKSVDRINAKAANTVSGTGFSTVGTKAAPSLSERSGPKKTTYVLGESS